MEVELDDNNNKKRGVREFIDFSFSFDNPKFSDRILRLEIRAEPQRSMFHGDDGEEGNDDQNRDTKIFHSWSVDCAAIRVRMIHVNSAILAGQSPFFHKLFSNGMRESEQRDITLHINCSEEVPFMDLLKFMYSGTLNAQTRNALSNVLMVADKFEVVPCMHHCIDALQSLLVTPESELTEIAKGFLMKHLSKNKKFEEEFMNLPLTAMEDMLSRDDLQVKSEDVLFDFVINWARKHYPSEEQRKEILCNRLNHLIRFPHMTNRKLKKILYHTDLDNLCALKLVSEALLFKADPPHKRRRIYTPEENRHKRFCARKYIHKPIRVMEFDTPHRECMVFWDIKKEDCLTIFPNKWLTSEAFYLGGQPFHLMAHCSASTNNNSNMPCFGLWLMMENKDEVIFALEYEFAARSKPSRNFSIKLSGLHRFCSKKMIGSSNLFSLPWQVFISDNSPYFIDDVIHLRSVLTMKT